MKKRLDVQSLLEGCDKENLVRFLRSRFAQNKNLANDFIIHFAASFDLEEEEFHLITDRIRQMFPRKISSLTHRIARPVKNHIQDLMEQTRDSHSRQNYRQAYVMISHVITLLDDYTYQIPEKYGFTKLQHKSYQLLDGIYKDSPAPSLKSDMGHFLRSIIRHGKAIPFQDAANPYSLLLTWENDLSQIESLSILESLEQKRLEYPEYSKLWLSQQIQIMIELDEKEKLVHFIRTHGDKRIIYVAMNQYLPEKWLDSLLKEELREQYINQESRPLKNTIYQILQHHGNDVSWMNELAVKEYFESGNIAILENLLSNANFDKLTLASYLERNAQDLENNQYFRLYSAYRYLDRPELLKDQLLQENDVFDILPFLGEVYPRYKDDVKAKLKELIETYLTSHFGPPAIQYVNSILDELIRLGHYDLQDYLIQKIRHSFGHRKHFQKLMKEMVQ